AAASQIVGPTVADRGSPHYTFDRFDFDSVDGQRRYRVQLAVPKAPPPAAGHPLLVMLDGNAAFGALTDEMLAQMAASGRPVAIAALGYQTEQAIDATARAYDYTPPVPGEHPTWDSEARQRRGGGADVFLDLIAQQVLPELRRRLPVDAARSTLWGHSYGGLLAVYALLTRPALFARYAAADPSLWWHDGFVLDLEPRATPLPAGRTTELLLMAGGAASAAQPGRTAPRAAAASGASFAEGTPAGRASRLASIAEAAPQLAARQAKRAGLSVQWMPFPGVGHGPMRAASIAPTLRLAAR
ncbi:MAG: alpha/beta hydrolase, partial [Comamonadaceae bacterium]